MFQLHCYYGCRCIKDQSLVTYPGSANVFRFSIEAPSIFGSYKQVSTFRILRYLSVKTAQFSPINGIYNVNLWRVKGVIANKNFRP